MRRNRTARLSVATAVALALVAAAVSALRGARHLGNGVAAQRALLERREAELRALPSLEARADSLRHRMQAMAVALLPGATAAEAQAELLLRVEQVDGGRGARLETAEAMPDSVNRGQLGRVLARATWVSDLAGVLDLVRRLEFGGSLLAVRELTLDATPVGAADPELIRAQVMVEGWYLRRESE